MTEKNRIIELKHSIPVPQEGGGTVDVNKITLQRVKAKHLKLLPDGFGTDGETSLGASEMLPLIAGLAGIPEESADEIDMEELSGVGEALGDFLAKSLQTGKN